MSSPRFVRSLATVAMLLIASAANAAGPRVTFWRLVGAPHDLGPVERAVLIYALGDSDMLRPFIEDLVEQVERGGQFRIVDVTGQRQHLIGDTISDAELKELRSNHPADAYLGISLFTCRDEKKEAPGSERDAAGVRKTVMRRWVEARCEARIDAIDGRTARRFVSFRVSGEGNSSHVSELTAEERDRAMAWAVRHMAVNVVQAIVPRRVRESIELDPSAPMFDHGMAHVEASDFDHARQVWEEALHRNRDSAPLLFNLAAVCEALGDLPAARKYYEDAVRHAPEQRHYGTELKLFQHRAAEQPMHARKP